MTINTYAFCNRFRILQIVKFLKKLSKSGISNTGEIDQVVDIAPQAKNHVSKSKQNNSRSLKDYHVKTESTEEESYNESYSKSFNLCNGESWEIDGYTTTDSDSDDSREVSRPEGYGRTRYQVHTMEKHEEEKALKDAHNDACRHLRDGRLVEAKAKFKEILATLVKEHGEENSTLSTSTRCLLLIKMLL